MMVHICTTHKANISPQKYYSMTFFSSQKSLIESCINTHNVSIPVLKMRTQLILWFVLSFALFNLKDCRDSI